MIEKSVSVVWGSDRREGQNGRGSKMYTKNSFRKCAGSLIILALVGCSTAGSSSIHEDPNEDDSAMQDQTKRPPVTELDRRLASADTAFGVKLFKLVAADTEKNVLISPASVGLCLAMAYNGAQGETKEAMSRALETQAISLDDLNRAYATLRGELENPAPKVQLQIANSLWARRGVGFNQSFIQRNQKSFGAEVSVLDFDSPSAPATINSWVNEKTKGKINQIVDRIDAQTLLFLINAIYFKGAWTKEFDKSKTKDEDFHSSPGQSKRVPMMSQSGEYNYVEGESFQAVSLPYSDRRVSMYIFLPKGESTLADLVAGLTADKWNAWMAQFQSNNGEISLPRFKIQYEITLNEALKSMGMGIAFDAGRADFSGMFQSGQNGFISQVKHKTFAEVNEEGTEAAAVTSAQMRATSMRVQKKPFKMVVDHPFLWAIRDNQTGTILFIGAETNPM
jgi:serine protease inhibitor